MKKTSGEIEEELKKNASSIDSDSLERLAYEIQAADQVFFVGVGRVMLVLGVCAKDLHIWELKAHCVGEITEPAITKKKICLLGIRIGASLFPLGIARKAKNLVGYAKSLHIGSNPNSEMKDICDFMVYSGKN